MNKYIKQILTGGIKFSVGVVVLLIIFCVIIPIFLNLFWGNDIQVINDTDLMLTKINLADNQNMFIKLDEISNEMIFEPKNFNLRANFLESSDWDNNFANDIFEKNEAALELWYMASQKNEFQIPSLSDPDEYSISIPAISTGRWRVINHISLAQAIRLANTGRIQSALDQAIKSVKIGNVILRSQNNSLIGYLVGMSIENDGLDALQKILAISKGRGINKYKLLSDLDEYRKNNDNYSFFKGEYVFSKDIFMNLDSQFENNNTVTGNILKQYSKNSFYYKPNMTIAYQADLQRQMINNIQTPCGKPIKIDMPFDINTNSIWGMVKLYFTENAIGKMLTNSSFLALNSLIKKTCDLKVKYEDTYNAISQY